MVFHVGNGKPRHVRFWPMRISPGDSTPESTRHYAQDNLQRMGFNIVLGPWEDQDVDDRDGIIARVLEN